MARPVTYNLQVVGGDVQSFDSDYLAADDLPRVSPPAAGGYTPTSVTVDQYGRVVAASSATPLVLACDADAHAGLVVVAHSAAQAAPLVDCQDSAHGSDDQYAFQVQADGSVNLPYLKGVYWRKSNTGQPSIKNTGNGALEISSADFAGFQIKLTATDFFWNADTSNLGANYQYLLTCGTAAAGVAAFEVQQRAGRTKYRINPDFDHEYWEQSSTAPRVAAKLARSWVTPTDATRAGRLTLGTYYTTTFQEGLRIDSGATVWTVYLANDAVAFASDGSALLAGGNVEVSAGGDISAGGVLSGNSFGVNSGNFSADANGAAVFAGGVVAIDLSGNVDFGSAASRVRADGSTRPAQIADASAANDSVYYSTTASKLVYKDSGGVVHALY